MNRHNNFPPEENKYNKKQTATVALAVIFFVSALIFGYLYFSCNGRNITFKKYLLLNPARDLYSKNDLIVNFQPLREDLTGIGNTNSGVSVYFEYLPTGANISINKDNGYFPASLLKLPAAFAVYKKIEEGEWKLSDEFEITKESLNPDFGDLYKKPPGTKMSVKDLLSEMLAKSDNTAYMVFVNNLESWELNEAYGHLGLDSLVSEDGQITARKYSVLLRSLYNATYLSDESSQEILGILSDSPLRGYLDQALPMDVVFAHKFGENKSHGVLHDAGIIYVPNRPYLLTVMIKDIDEVSAKKLTNRISAMVYNYVSGYSE